MQLELRNGFSKEYRSNLTRELDEISCISSKHYSDSFHHYILANKWCLDNRCLAIRVPGRTVGGIWIDDNNKILKISIDLNTLLNYPDNVSEIVEKYVGEEIEIGGEYDK